MTTSEKAELTASVSHSERFQNQKYRFINPKSRKRLAEKREGEEPRQLQSIIRFMYMQQINNIKVKSATIKQIYKSICMFINSKLKKSFK